MTGTVTGRPQVHIDDSIVTGLNMLDSKVS